MKTATAIVLAALALALAAPGAAQETTGEPPAAAEKLAPASKPGVREDTDAALQRARALADVGSKAATSDADAAFVQREEDNFSVVLQRYRDASPADMAATPSLELGQSRTAAALALNTVEERRRALGSTIDRIRSAQDELDASHARWSQLLEKETRRGSPPALLDRIKTLLGAIDGSRDTLHERSQALLEIDNRLATLKDRLTRVSGRLDEAQQSPHRFFNLTAPPLWRALRPSESARAMESTSYGAEWARAVQTTRQFWANFFDRMILHFIVFGLLLGATVSLSRSPALRALEPLSGSVRVLKRPISSATLIAIVLSPVFYPAGLPLSLAVVVRLVSLIPVLRLIPTFISPAWLTLCYFVAGLYGLHTLLMPLPAGTLVSRGVLLAMAAGALWVATVGLNRRFADTSFADRRWQRVARFARLVVVLLLLIAIGANLIGAMDLALLLIVDAVAPAYLGIGLAAATFAIDDFVRLTLYGKNLQQLRSIALHRQMLLRRASTVTRWLAGVLWLWLTLRVLGLDDAIRARIDALLAASTTVGTLQLSLGNILLFVAVVWIAVLVARFVSFVLDNDVLPRMRLARGLPGTVTTSARYLIVGLGLLAGASIAGVDLTKITLILGALSVGIGFGLQNIVNNFISGVILLFERPIQVGDTIQVGELYGVVRSIGIRASNVRTYSGAEVIVPNAELIAGQVVNWTLSDRYRRLELDVGVAYGNRPADVIAILLEVVNQHEAALKIPAPAVRFRGFGESSLDFRLYVWVDFDEGMAATSAILCSVYDALAAAGIEIPFPQRDLHVRSVSESASRALRGEPR